MTIEKRVLNFLRHKHVRVAVAVVMYANCLYILASFILKWHVSPYFVAFIVLVGGAFVGSTYWSQYEERTRRLRPDNDLRNGIV